MNGIIEEDLRHLISERIESKGHELTLAMNDQRRLISEILTLVNQLQEIE